MFLRSSNLICELARWEALPAPQAAGAAQERLRGEARLAMSRDLPAMPLSRRLADPAAWRRLQQGRRQALEALMLSEADADAQERILDLVCMIAEESTWSDNPDAAPFDDEQHPVIDFQCAETLMLLGWVRRGLGERLGPRVVAKIQYEARRRVFIPFLAHADYPFMRFALPRSRTGRRPLCILSDILLSAILLEGDPGRRTSVIRSALRLMDQGIRAREDRPLPLADELAETAAVTDLCVLLRKLTRGKVDLTQTYPTSDWLDGLLFAWLGGDWFIDPAAGALRQGLCGQELFRSGLAAGDEALTALGAALHRLRPRPSSTVTGRVLEPACEGLLTAETDAPPRLLHAAAPRNRVMLSRMAGMTIALHTGGNLANAGAIALFSGNSPILVETPGCACVPLIGGKGQMKDPWKQVPEAAFGGEICPADFHTEPDRDLLSVDLTRSWPVESGVRSAQRTVMVLREDAVIRIVDAFDLETPSPLTFCFFTPCKPLLQDRGVRLGPVRLNWEGDMKCHVTDTEKRFPQGDAAGEPLYRIAVSPADPAARSFYTFDLTYAGKN